MQYYTFELNDESQNLYTICTPSGMYNYTRFPMGLKYSIYFDQAAIENILCSIDDADVNIDDVGTFTDYWKAYLHLIDDILHRFKDNGFTINPIKC